MPKDDVSNLPTYVQASIKAAKEAAAEEEPEMSIDYRGEPKISAQAQPAKKKVAPKKKTYVVQSGDSLSKIAKELLDDAARWPEIFELNKDQIENPDLIYPGQELRLP